MKRNQDDDLFEFKFEEEKEEEDEEDCYFQVEVSWSKNQLRLQEENKQAILIGISYITLPAPPLTVLSLSASEPKFNLSKYFRP